MNPVSDLVKAVVLPIKAVFVVGLCFFINVFTSPGAWWFQWVAFGMAIAVLCVWFRALRVILAGAGVAGIAYLVHRWWTKRSAAPAAARHESVIDMPS